jgi:phenylacetate 2-hydroxylase
VLSIPEVSGAVPFIGHLNSLGGRLGKNDSTVYSEWSTRMGTDLFQMKLGDQRTLVANTFQTIKDLWVGHANDLIDRPYQHGFAEKLEYDLSGAAMTEPIRRCRKAAMRALGKPMWLGYYPLLEPSSVDLIKNIHKTGIDGAKGIEIYPFLRNIVFDLALSLTYGTRMTAENNDFVSTLIKNINNISHLRSSTQRYRDFTPALRFLIPDALSSNVVVTSEKIRQQYLDIIYADLQRRIGEGEEINCIVNGLVNDKLSLPESHGVSEHTMSHLSALTNLLVIGVCKALLQAAPDSTASSVYIGIGWLSSPTGRSYQHELYAAIMSAYEGDRDKAWDMAFREEKVPLIVSFYKETLRFFTTTPFATPRTTVNDIKYRGIVIPKGITMIMNAQQGNHDKSWYGEDAETFNPKRFIANDTPLPHLTFGAGSRICPAVALSNRII